jgi:uncharacterized protein (TIGR02996 family)
MPSGYHFGMTDLDALLAAVEADLADAAPRLVLADYLQENGLDPDLERGLRFWAAIDWLPTPPHWRSRGDWHFYDQRYFEGRGSWRENFPWPDDVYVYVCADKVERLPVGGCGCCAPTLAALVRCAGRALDRIAATKEGRV